MDLVSVVVPTLNRPLALNRALMSLLNQKLPTGINLEICVVDNSRDGTARPTVDALPTQLTIPLRYLSEPTPGVSSARNAGVRAASGRWIAFLDDDEEACDTWITSLVAVARATSADAVFGPVTAKADGGGNGNGNGNSVDADGVASAAPFARYFSRSIDRPNACTITDLAAYLGTNNSMFDKSRCLADPAPFDPTLNSIGGEDSLLLQRLVIAGCSFAWCQTALVTEWVPPKRLTWNYVFKRKFLSGQIRVFVLHKLRPVRWPLIAWWMAAGLVQTIVGGLARLVLWPFKGAGYNRASVMFYAGLGKVLWMPRFRPSLYGQGLVS